MDLGYILIVTNSVSSFMSFIQKVYRQLLENIIILDSFVPCDIPFLYTQVFVN